MVAALVVICDATIYHGKGFAGYSLLFAAAPMLLVLGSPHVRGRNGSSPVAGTGLGLLALMLLALSAKLLWCGSNLLIGIGFALLAAFATRLSGLSPYVLEVLVFASQTIQAGYHGAIEHGRFLSKALQPFGRANWLNFVLPLFTLVLFSVLFVLANPDLLASFSESLRFLAEGSREWLEKYAPGPVQILFWGVVFWISVGLLRPYLRAESLPVSQRPLSPIAQERSPAPLYSACQNVLLSVTVLFAGYLAFEFKTLWFRVFPTGFHYSGYAHEGAAWLTVALALSTVILSLIFRGDILADPRLPRLRRLAWLWSLENLVLGLAVYHRLFIYVGFNGMTRMRIVGLFGISTVLVGFLMVLWKISRNRDFLWLVRRQLWALSLAVFLYALVPVDTLVVHYNVGRILAGDPAPSVQISVHPISSEGVLHLLPLLESEDAIIREGIRALLAERHDQAEALARRWESEGWTSYQVSDERVLEGLRQASPNWASFKTPDDRATAVRRFHDYAYQWY